MSGHNNIAGKTVFITGGSSGLGEATARHLAAKGAKVAIAARRMEKLEKIAADIAAAGGQALPLKLDVTRADAVKAAVKQAAEYFGRLDVMVNNAGLAAIALLEKGSTEDWSRMIDVNIKGALHGIAAALPLFKEQGGGHMINIASLAGRTVLAPGGVVYSCTKYAVRAISEGLRKEAGKTIRVSCIEPGFAQSEILSGEVDEGLRPQMEGLYKNAIPADSVARAIAYVIEQPAEVDVNEVLLRPTADN